ncbi:PH domain-containing protein [Methylobacterium phyllostachyos]|uniref:PH domain-containing protein n=1 Tax=Methylobacterium phyllostachyos TaxID=582672 RepID=A0A1G9VY98_9HYPH|nr:photosynthetic complex putative assembly protein PuhB [Methylobacterium phyllostachyos]SDM77272.1 PH domain-containing protein [Methylobacterium phyllostachyos]
MSEITTRMDEPGAVGFTLEPGEQILWQGRPQAQALRRHLLKVRWVMAYVCGLIAWKLALIVWVRGLRPQEVSDVAALVIQGTALGLILTYFAWALARNTTYTLTSLRLVIHHGIALQGTVDIPLRALRSVAVRHRADGSGDIALEIRDGGGIGFAKLWPHVRGANLAHPIPMLRGLSDAAVLGSRLSRQLSRFHDMQIDTTMQADVPIAAARAA